jgi:exosome complex component RRP4
MTTKIKKEIVIPGEIISKSSEFLPGDWTTKQGDNILATRLGIVEKYDKLIKIIPITGVYIPRGGNVVIGEIKDITMNGWMVDIGGPYSSFLPLRECPGFIEEPEMENVYGIGELIVTRIFDVRRTSIDLTMKSRERGLGKIKDGMIVRVNPHRVPRVIGKEGSMIKLIKDASNCYITVGQNGLIWIKGETIEEESFAKKIIEYIVDNTLTEGLTENVEKWITENKPASIKSKPKVEEQGSEERIEVKE